MSGYLGEEKDYIRGTSVFRPGSEPESGTLKSFREDTVAWEYYTTDGNNFKQLLPRAFVHAKRRTPVEALIKGSEFYEYGAFVDGYSYYGNGEPGQPKDPALEFLLNWVEKQLLHRGLYILDRPTSESGP